MKIYMINHEPWQWSLNSTDDNIISQFVIGKDDLIGENITNEQPLLEGRFMYWLWKNARYDYVGLQFRRRFLYLRPMFDNDDRWKEINYRSDLSNDISMRIHPEEFMGYCRDLASRPVKEFEWIYDYDCITSKPEIYGYPLGTQYCACHRAQDWNIFTQVLRTEGFTDDELTVPYLHPSNIWIMKWELFEEYATIWWRVFSALRQVIEPPNHPYQSRVFGFLMERFFTIWLGREHKHMPDLKVKLLPILFGDGL